MLQFRVSYYGQIILHISTPSCLFTPHRLQISGLWNDLYAEQFPNSPLVVFELFFKTENLYLP